MVKIGIVGYFGYNNLGDEWFVWTWKKLFEGYAQVHIVHPLESIEQLDAIIIGGGDLVLPNRINNHYFREELYRKPYWIYGVGTISGQWTNPDVTSYYRRVFAGAQRAYVRDPFSRKILLSNNFRDDIQLVEDITWAGPLYESYIKAEFSYEDDNIPVHRDWLGFSVRPAPMYNREQFSSFLDEVISTLRYQVIGVPLQPSDLPGLSDLLEHLAIAEATNRISGAGVRVIPPDLSLEKRMTMIARCRIYVTLRFHGLITGLRYRVPTVALTHQHAIKFKALAEKVSPDLLVTDIASLHARVAALAQAPPDYESVVSKIEANAAYQLRMFRNEVLSCLGAPV